MPWRYASISFSQNRRHKHDYEIRDTCHSLHDSSYQTRIKGRYEIKSRNCNFVVDPGQTCYNNTHPMIGNRCLTLNFRNGHKKSASAPSFTGEQSKENQVSATGVNRVFEFWVLSWKWPKLEQSIFVLS